MGSGVEGRVLGGEEERVKVEVSRASPVEGVSPVCRVGRVGRKGFGDEFRPPVPRSPPVYRRSGPSVVPS